VRLSRKLYPHLPSPYIRGRKKLKSEEEVVLYLFTLTIK